MCGCDCCQNSNPTCFNPDVLGIVRWACWCSCPNCISRVIAGAEAKAYSLMGAAIQSAIEAEQQRIVFIVEDYYRVAPKAAEPLLRLIKEESDD